MTDIQEIKVGAFTYRINIVPKEDGATFDIYDNVVVKGEVMPDVICSGKIDIYGRCKCEVYCDVHAAMALGEIMKVVYDKCAEVME